MNVPLAMNRPLWQLLVVQGTSAGHVGIVLRIHHAIADGMAAVAIVQQLFEKVNDALLASAAAGYPAAICFPHQGGQGARA